MKWKGTETSHRLVMKTVIIIAQGRPAAIAGAAADFAHLINVQ